MAEAQFTSPAEERLAPAVRRLPRWGLQVSERRALLLIGDLIATGAATVLALWFWTFTSGASFSLAYLAEKAGWFFWLISAWLALSADLYDLRRAASRRATAQGLLLAGAVGGAFYLGVYFFAPLGALPRLVVLYFIAGACTLEFGWRLIYMAVFVSHPFQRRVLVVGAGWAGETILQALAEFQPDQYAVMGLFDDDPSKQGATLCGAPVLGDHRSLLATAREQQVSEIVLAISGEIGPGMFTALLECQQQGMDIVRMPVLYEQVTGQVPIQHLDADWLLTSFVDTVRLNTLARGVRRTLDLCGGLVGLLALAALFPWLAALIWLEDRGPVLYRQVRVGRGGRQFSVLKFRTMAADAEADGQARWAERDDARVTRAGRLLRRLRLDEAPQFWNVLRGEMSLVGPRPERPEFVQVLEAQIPFYRARLLVKPGLTGWAQINYGYGNTVEDALVKLQYDLYYIKHRSIGLDLSILARTMGVVLGFKGT